MSCVETKVKKRCLKCKRKFNSYIVRIYNGDKLIKKTVGPRVCGPCGYSNKRAAVFKGHQIERADRINAEFSIRS